MKCFGSSWDHVSLCRSGYYLSSLHGVLWKEFSRHGWLTYCCISSQTKVDSQADSKTLELTQGLEEDWAETVSVMVDLELKSFVSSTSQRYQVDFESSDSLKARNSQWGGCRVFAERPSLRTIMDLRLAMWSLKRQQEAMGGTRLKRKFFLRAHVLRNFLRLDFDLLRIAEAHHR